MTESTTLVGAPDEVVTNAILRMVSLLPFGHNGELALITLIFEIQSFFRVTMSFAVTV